jgi:hypothetical protein
MALLFVTRNIESNYGGGIVSLRNLRLCKEIDPETTVVSLSGNKTKSDNSNKLIFLHCRKSRIRTLLNSLLFLCGGLGLSDLGKIVKMLEDGSYTTMFFDGSYYGRLVKLVHKKYPEILQIVFFHNIEEKFYRDMVRSLGLRYISVYLAAYYNEFLSARYCNKVIALNQREANELRRLYKRKVDIIIPVSLKDRFCEEKIRKNNTVGPIKLLFAGSLFYANYDGIKWFVNNVMNKVEAYLFIVGSGFEKKREEFTRQNVMVVGSCSDMSEFYYDSDVVVLPIFSGAGMKVKTAEALMYGKMILGTSEAFEGYKINDFERVGGLCNTKYEFIKKINELSERKDDCRFNAYSRDIFCRYYKENDSNNRMIASSMKDYNGPRYSGKVST